MWGSAPGGGARGGGHGASSSLFFWAESESRESEAQERGRKKINGLGMDAWALYKGSNLTAEIDSQESTAKI